MRTEKWRTCKGIPKFYEPVSPLSPPPLPSQPPITHSLLGFSGSPSHQWHKTYQSSSRLILRWKMTLSQPGSTKISFGRCLFLSSVRKLRFRSRRGIRGLRWVILVLGTLGPTLMISNILTLNFSIICILPPSSNSSNASLLPGCSASFPSDVAVPQVPAAHFFSLGILLAGGRQKRKHLTSESHEIQN